MVVYTNDFFYKKKSDKINTYLYSLLSLKKIYIHFKKLSYESKNIFYGDKSKSYYLYSRKKIILCKPLLPYRTFQCSYVTGNCLRPVRFKLNSINYCNNFALIYSRSMILTTIM